MTHSSHTLTTRDPRPATRDPRHSLPYYSPGRRSASRWREAHTTTTSSYTSHGADGGDGARGGGGGGGGASRGELSEWEQATLETCELMRDKLDIRGSALDPLIAHLHNNRPWAYTSPHPDFGPSGP